MRDRPLCEGNPSKGVRVADRTRRTPRPPAGRNKPAGLQRSKPSRWCETTRTEHDIGAWKPRSEGEAERSASPGVDAAGARRRGEAGKARRGGIGWSERTDATWFQRSRERSEDEAKVTGVDSLTRGGCPGRPRGSRSTRCPASAGLAVRPKTEGAAAGKSNDRHLDASRRRSRRRSRAGALHRPRRHSQRHESRPITPSGADGTRAPR
jgi:hypothetical protein